MTNDVNLMHSRHVRMLHSQLLKCYFFAFILYTSSQVTFNQYSPAITDTHVTLHTTKKNNFFILNVTIS